MRFDVFHSIGRIDSITPRLNDRAVFEHFFAQVILAEQLGFQTVWVAESHFSSETQKSNPHPVIPNYHGEVGLNCDSPQLAAHIFGRTKKIGFGTAILNIVGGNGGPLGAADRIRSLAFLNEMSDHPRQLDIGVAVGRFPYINRPYGIVPRNRVEECLWKQTQQLVFAEALEIFLRLSAGETLASPQVQNHSYSAELCKDGKEWLSLLSELGLKETESLPYTPRWNFESLKLVPNLPSTWHQHLHFVLGSSDPYAQNVGIKQADLDIFNLSFTHPDKIDETHREMTDRYHKLGRAWFRHRMPRTVLVFIDKDKSRAQESANSAFDTYIEAMRGTVGTPPKSVLLERALIGDAAAIRDQLSPHDAHRFHADDRLMLWFEFNDSDNERVMKRMRYFAEEVMPHYQ